MKNLILVCASALLIISCGGNKASDNSLEGKKQQLANKRAELAALQSAINQLESDIKSLDTSAVFTEKPLVTVATIQKENFAQYTEVQGAINAHDPGFASSETGGRLVRLLINEGQMVSKGQLIGSVDLESINKGLGELETRMQLARDVYTRQENLWKQNIGSEVQYLQAKNQVEALEKARESLRFNLSKANIYAPMSGVVEKILIRAGEMTGPGSPICQIFNLGSLIIKASIPETMLKSVRVGQSIRVSLPSINEEIDVRINEIGRIINPTNRTFEIEAALPNPRGIYKPFMMANVKIKESEVAGVCVVPTEMIMQDLEGKDYVYVAETGADGKTIAKRRDIERGLSYLERTSVKSGLTPGEKLIIKGARQITEGDEVEITGTEAIPGTSQGLPSNVPTTTPSDSLKSSK
jgi:membrane fusion protein (multidrug efflux system)